MFVIKEKTKVHHPWCMPQIIYIAQKEEGALHRALKHPTINLARLRTDTIKFHVLLSTASIAFEPFKCGASNTMMPSFWSYNMMNGVKVLTVYTNCIFSLIQQEWIGGKYKHYWSVSPIRGKALVLVAIAFYFLVLERQIEAESRDYGSFYYYNSSRKFYYFFAKQIFPLFHSSLLLARSAVISLGFTDHKSLGLPWPNFFCLQRCLMKY